MHNIIKRRKPLSEEHKKNISKSCKGTNKGEKNGMWKGEKASYKAKHMWINRNKPKPEFCEVCNKNKVYDAANISGKYLLDFDDWIYVCRSCHMKSDQRILNLKQYRKVSACPVA